MKILNHMGELNFTVPLAKFESEEWLDSSDGRYTTFDVPTNKETHDITKHKYHSKLTKHSRDNLNNSDNFLDSFSFSLEDLVNSFDEKVTRCFSDYKENAGTIAPIQMRTEEEILSECPTWWTLTGNFGSFLPIDWDKTIAKKLYVPSSIDSRGRKDGEAMSSDEDSRDYGDECRDSRRSRKNQQHNYCDDSKRDSALAPNSDFEEATLPIETAEEVIKEINRMLKDSPTASQDSGVTPEISSPSTCTFDSGGINNSFCLDSYPPYNHDDLVTHSTERLSDVRNNTQHCIDEQSQRLVNELNTRDELEYEKELKNTFITLIHTIQTKKRVVLTANPGLTNFWGHNTRVDVCNNNNNRSSTLIGKLTNLVQNGHNGTPSPNFPKSPNSSSTTSHSYNSSRDSTASVSSSCSMNNFADESCQRSPSSNTFNMAAGADANNRGSTAVSSSSQYLTTVIPYNYGKGSPDVLTLRILIKILTAINEDDDQVPSLLTDYILKVICPSEAKSRE